MRTTTPLPDTEYLRALFNYEPDTGVLSWKDDTGKKKKEVGSPDKKEYLLVNLHGRILRVHRICYAIHHGKDPYPLTIDHINRDTSDNRICNLREADSKLQSENQTHNGGCERKPVRVIFPDERGTVETATVTEAARLLRKAKGTISRILNEGRTQLYEDKARKKPTGIRLEWI
jgi:hypothetical protein